MDTWRENISRLIAESGYSKSEIADIADLSGSMISVCTNQSDKLPTMSTLVAIASALGCTVYDFFKEEGQDVTVIRGKPLPMIMNNDLKNILEWTMEQDDPNRIAGNIRFMVETRYPDFEEWQKKRGEWREDVGISQNE